MHPSPDALTRMTTDDLNDYREELREVAIDTNDLSGAYMQRVSLIDAILSDRKLNSNLV